MRPLVAWLTARARRASRHRRLILVGVTWASVVVAFSIPATAQAADCSLAAQSYDGACGPAFQLPAWGDAAGWSDPSKYTTIQLADLTGNGKDELIARNDDGIEIWEFDTTLGQWRPAVDASGLPQVLTDFRSPLPSESGPNWTQPQYYKTIQTADLYGNGAREIIARFHDGMRVYKYTPPAGSRSIDGGSWSLVSQDGPFSDADGWTDPSLYLTIQTADVNHDHKAELISQSRSGVVVYDWDGSRFVKDPSAPPIPYTGDEAQYLDLKTASLPNQAGGTTPVIVDRDAGGVRAAYRDSVMWHTLVTKPNPGQFSDVDVSPDCYTQKHGCFSASPSYYETLRFADIDGQPGQEMLGRLSDGLRVYKLSPDKFTWQPLATLTDLGGAGDDPALKPGMWASIRTANIDGGKHGDDVLALDGTGLQAWSYDAKADAWTKLKPATPLALSGELWDNHPEYYSTIQTGDVTGDGREAVIARGPYGIRTWFYDLKPNSGWTSWLPQDAQGSYPQFSGGQQGDAFKALNAEAHASGVIPASDASVRDVWTGENAPLAGDLDRLGGKQGILSFAGCPEPPSTVNPPSYKACTPPQGTSGFTAADWTAVVNEILSEIYSAQQVVAFFDQLDHLRHNIFLAQGAELPAIGSQLKLAGAAGNETRFDIKAMFSTVLSIAGAIAGVVPGGSAASAGLGVAASVVGALPSASSTLTSKFDTTYSGLQAKFATAVTEVDKALSVQSQQVRQNGALLTLIAQLRSRGTWNPDAAGLTSAANEGFALWVYKQLLPTLYARYTITNCRPGYPNPLDDCDGPAEQQGVVGGGANFTALVPPPYESSRPLGTPCHSDFNGNYSFYTCHYTTMPADLASTLFGAVSPECAYTPGNTSTAWTFGCNLGVKEENSVSLPGGPLNGWNFANYSGDPVAVGSSSGHASIGDRGSVRLTGRITLPRAFRLADASVVAERLLYDLYGGDELARRPSGRALVELRLTGHGQTGVLRSGAGAQPLARLTLGRSAHRSLSFGLGVTGVAMSVPAACHALPASDALHTPPFTLDTELQISDGRLKRTVSLPTLWRCVRNRAGAISALQTVAPTRLPAHQGLALSLRGPRTVRPGATVTYRVQVRNRRAGRRDRILSSLWHLLVQGGVTANATNNRPKTMRWPIAELRRGRTRTLPLHFRVPRSAAGRLCITATAGADSARSAGARLCPRIVPIVPPPVGLG